MNEKHRRAAVSGRFYSDDPARLERDVRACLGAPAEEERIAAIVAPHAGYVYSGPIAGETYARAHVPARAIVLCPNHTGLGPARSASAADVWDLPGGSVPVDVELRDRLVEQTDLNLDDMAHLREHAAEVHLPFLRAKNPTVKVVPICLGLLPLAECVALGARLARVIEEQSPGASSSILLVASTDMSHYVSADVARRLDSLAIAKIVELDPEGLYDIVMDYDISMCGFVPTTVALAAARALGARSGRLVRYGNSGDTSGDTDSVVGYAGALVS